MARVRYMVDDVGEAIDFYTTKLGFELDQKFGSAFAIVTSGDLELLLAGPRTSAGHPMPDGTIPTPGGGWARFLLPVDDLEAEVHRLKNLGVEFRNDIVENQGRKQILCLDPSGNIIELSEAPTATAP